MTNQTSHEFQESQKLDDRSRSQLSENYLTTQGDLSAEELESFLTLGRKVFFSLMSFLPFTPETRLNSDFPGLGSGLRDCFCRELPILRPNG